MATTDSPLARSPSAEEGGRNRGSGGPKVKRPSRQQQPGHRKLRHQLRRRRNRPRRRRQKLQRIPQQAQKNQNTSRRLSHKERHRKELLSQQITNVIPDTHKQGSTIRNGARRRHRARGRQRPSRHPSKFQQQHRNPRQCQLRLRHSQRHRDVRQRHNLA